MWRFQTSAKDIENGRSAEQRSGVRSALRLNPISNSSENPFHVPPP
jgi:hypothetical protein